jgi:small subunit ribosomal protein S10
MAKARVKLFSHKLDELNEFIKRAREIADKLGIKLIGPIPLKTKRLKITTRKSPDGEGKYSQDRFEMRIHKRIIEFPITNDRMLRSVMKIPITKNIKLELKLV